MSNNLLNLIVQFTGVDKLSGGLKNIIGLGRSGGQILGGMQREARGLERELRDVRRQLEGATGDVSALANQERELERRLEGANAAIRRQRDELARQARNARMDTRGQELRTAGQEQMLGGATLLTPIVLAAKSAMDFSSGMVDIQQKANLTNRATDKLGQTIVRNAKAAKLLPEEYRSGVDILLAKGMELDAALSAMQPAGKMATAFKVPVDDAAAAAHASVNNLKISAGQTNRIFDAMAAAGNAGGFEVKDMARHFPALTAQMQALGQQGVPAVADLSAALQVAMHTAGNSDEAGNNIKNLLAKINSPGTIKAFEKNFGVNLPAAMAKLEKQGHSSLEAIAMITQQATGGDSKKLGFAFEDMQARQGIMALIQNMGEYRKIREAALNSQGTVDSAFDQRVARDANVNWKALIGSISGFAITVGSTLLPAATATFDILNSVVTTFGEWAQANPAVAGTLMQIVAGVAAFKIGMGAMTFLFGGTLSSLSRLMPVLRFARVAVLMLGRGVLQAGLMMMANPMVALIVGIGLALAGLAYLVYSNWDTIKAAFTNGWNMVKSVLAAAPGWLRTIGGQMMQGLLALINPVALAQRLLAVARNGIAAFKNFFGIKSPSRLFMEMGDHMTSGLAIGVDRGGQRPLQAMGRLSAGMAGAGPSAAGSAALGGAGGMVPGKTEIHIHQREGEDAQALAERVVRMLDRRDGQRGLASYTDTF